MLRDYVRRLKEQQVAQASDDLEALKRGRDVVQERADYYTSRDYMNDWETLQATLSETAAFLQVTGQALEMSAGGAVLDPDVFLGALAALGGGVVNLEHLGGGTKSAGAASSFGRGLEMLASFTGAQASMAGTQGSYQRRADDWAFQARLAQKELAQVDQQIASAEIRVQLASWELENHDKQTDNAQRVQDFLGDKFTSADLYEWMQGELASLFFQAYQMAYNVAKRAERAYRVERGVTTSNFIQFGYWDSLRKGLLAGERLQLALRQMERAYIDQNKRDYEITRQVSLLLHDPIALITLSTCVASKA
jgi:hypothetical protein